MTKPTPDEMLEATRLTKSGRLTEATALIQRLLRGEIFASPGTKTPETKSAALPPPLLDLSAEDVSAPAPPTETASESKSSGERLKPKVKEPLQRQGPARLVDNLQTLAPALKRKTIAPAELLPTKGVFVSKSFTNAAGTRAYRLYIPAIGHSAPDDPRPLIIMLHGCTQSGDDFAAGSRMNFAAETEGCYVAYPEQVAAANASKCWNWFQRGHQSRDQGEPSLIAGIAQQIMADHTIDSRRVYIAGLSAGGAAAAVVADAYPDVFAAAGVHSGVACGVARDLPSAFTAMQGRHGPYTPSAKSLVPTIVFHGDADTTVHPRNGAEVVAGAAAGETYPREIEQGTSAGGRNFTRSVQRDETGRSVIEEWVIHGAGHAWSGGSTAGSFTDPRGPDATAEMLRFFLAHTRQN